MTQGIPDTTQILLTQAERNELDGLVRPTKAGHRLRQPASLDETGNRGAELEYTSVTTRRILAVLQLKLLEGYGR